MNERAVARGRKGGRAGGVSGSMSVRGTERQSVSVGFRLSQPASLRGLYVVVKVAASAPLAVWCHNGEVGGEG